MNFDPIGKPRDSSYGAHFIYGWPQSPPRNEGERARHSTTVSLREICDIRYTSLGRGELRPVPSCVKWPVASTVGELYCGLDYLYCGLDFGGGCLSNRNRLFPFMLSAPLCDSFGFRPMNGVLLGFVYGVMRLSTSRMYRQQFPTVGLGWNWMVKPRWMGGYICRVDEWVDGWVAKPRSARVVGPCASATDVIDSTFEYMWAHNINLIYTWINFSKTVKKCRGGSEVFCSYSLSMLYCNQSRDE